MKKIAVIFGGQSTEHDISIITALASIIRPLRASKHYDVVPVYISKAGRWYSEEALTDIATFRTGRIEEIIQKSKPVWLEMGEGLTLIKGGLKTTKTKIDVVFPSMHGTNGEDGALMGLLQMAGVAYVGCEMRASVVAMDKALSKTVVESSGVDVAKSVHVLKSDYESSLPGILQSAKQLRLPLFIKPTNLGSSIGISRITSYDELENALEVAFHYDDAVLIEEAVQNLIEVTVPVMGNEAPKPALVEKPMTKSDEFFDFSTKYLNQGGKKSKGATGTKGAQGYSQLPAELPDGLYKLSEETALKVYKVLGCTGTARIDLLIDSLTGTVYFNEINPLSGSLYAHNWQQAGMPPIQLVEELVDLAVARYDSRQKQDHIFASSFLKQF